MLLRYFICCLFLCFLNVKAWTHPTHNSQRILYTPWNYKSNFFTRKYKHRKETRLNALLRPDWLRRASRIKRIKEEKTKQVYQSLKQQQKQLGIGKLYRCRNPHNYSSFEEFEKKQQIVGNRKEQLLNVYLNIPENEYEASDETNIIHRLKDGEIVRSTAPKQGNCIEHDQGGWSAEILEGMTRLEPLEDPQ